MFYLQSCPPPSPMLDNSICLKKFLYVHGIYSCSVTIPLQTILIQLTRPQHPLACSPPKSIPLVTLILSPKSRKWPTSLGIHNLFVKIDSSLPRHALFHFPFPVPSSLPSLYPSKFYFFLPNPLEPPHPMFILSIAATVPMRLKFLQLKIILP